MSCIVWHGPTSHLLDDQEFLHAPYVDLNAAILEQLKAGKSADAARAIEAYPERSVRTVLAAFSRLGEVG